MSPFFTSDFWKEQYGNIASVIGLGIALIGFAITIIGVARAKNSADQARQIANDLLHQFGARVFLGHIGEAIRLLNDLRSDCRSKSWERAIYHGEHLQRVLISLIESPYPAQAEQIRITSAIDDLTLLLRRIEGDLIKSKPTQLTSMHQRFFWELSTFLIHLDSRLKNPANETKDGSPRISGTPPGTAGENPK